VRETKEKTAKEKAAKGNKRKAEKWE